MKKTSAEVVIGAIGVDLGDRRSQVCVLDELGGIIEVAADSSAAPQEARRAQRFRWAAEQSATTPYRASAVWRSSATSMSPTTLVGCTPVPTPFRRLERKSSATARSIACAAGFCPR